MKPHEINTELGETQGEIRCELEELGNHLLKIAKGYIDNKVVADAIDKLETETEVLSSLNWQMYLIGETKEEYKERMLG